MPTNDELTFTLESTGFDTARLRVRAFTGRESISALYSYRIEVICLDASGPDPDEMTGAAVTLVLERPPQAGAQWSGVRRLHGIVASVVDLLSTHGDVPAYRLEVVPRAHALTMVKTQDIMVGASVPDAVAAKIDAVSLTDALSMRLLGSYAPREFVVQYHETDLAFVSRLTEHLGISYFFLHGDDGESLVFTDHTAGFGLARDEPVLYHAGGEPCGVVALESARHMVPAYFAVRDYNYRAPLVELTAEHELDAGFAGGVIEFGTNHKTPDEGAALARVRAEEHLSGQLVYTGESVVPSLGAGLRFTLEGHPKLDRIELLITSIEHHGSQVVGLDRADHAGDARAPGYRNRFTAIPTDRTYRPPRVTPCPRIAGLVTGVVDPGGVEGTRYAQIDDQGRYLVRFLFDTTASGERAVSHRVRMIQNHAGEGYGTHFPLKPGVEVVLAFVNGDPDRPLIVGAVPNPTRPSPVTGANPGLHRIKTLGGVMVDLGE